MSVESNWQRAKKISFNSLLLNSPSFAFVHSLLFLGGGFCVCHTEWIRSHLAEWSTNWIENTPPLRRSFIRLYAARNNNTYDRLFDFPNERAAARNLDITSSSSLLCPASSYGWAHTQCNVSVCVFMDTHIRNEKNWVAFSVFIRGSLLREMDTCEIPRGGICSST